MVLKSAFVATVCTVLLALGGVAFADEYRPSEFFGLDLSTAVLSPKRLGPSAQFEPVAVEANSERRNDAQVSVEPKVVQPQVKPRKPVRTTRVMAPVEQPRKIARVPARAKLARRHNNPLDAEARDIRIQTWPCKSGGICGWRR
ncbi:signal peptide protein [Bradyrhizobium sp. LTSP885]|uniref:hypothetical protein n=1 Tax=Bradyrhizobium sp. LTSP885 TaxID=1619232 RepID=UPI0005CA0254|nr:hypothetical protein [Bradyrhizobium sp. LTSP885]KJC46640.1 signal peptide protein [Bradyrhizobium sp. LTSP885]